MVETPRSSPPVRIDIRWVAREGETPGWDIQYIDANDEIVAVEVGDINIMAARVGGAQFIVSATPGLEHSPDVSGDRVAYIIEGDVEVWDTTALVRTRVTNDAAVQSHVHIAGDVVAWSDDRNGNLDVFLYDLLDGQTYQLTSDPSNQVVGDLTPDRVVYHDQRLGDSNVWETHFTIGVFVGIWRTARVRK